MGLAEVLGRNLRQPTGLLGKLTGFLMNKGNDFMNRFTIRFLDPQSDDRILEIGFGNGKYIREIAQVTRNGFVAGVDYSQTMVDQAKKRNRAMIAQRRVEIKLGEVNRMPFESESFDKVFTVNTIYFWPNPESDIREIGRLIKPGGLLILSFRSKEKMEKLEFTKNGFTLYEPSRVIELVRDAGFQDIRIESADDRNVDVNCVIARK